jgi:ribonuclease VapC
VIVVDTSALMAILLGEPEAADCRSAISAHADLLISAPTMTEALIVAAGRQLHGEMAALIDALMLTVTPLSEARAYAAVRAYRRWGKGFHLAKLNFGDAFAYALAEEMNCPLLYVGDDFARTDVQRATSGDGGEENQSTTP